MTPIHRFPKPSWTLKIELFQPLAYNLGVDRRGYPPMSDGLAGYLQGVHQGTLPVCPLIFRAEQCGDRRHLSVGHFIIRKGARLGQHDTGPVCCKSRRCIA